MEQVTGPDRYESMQEEHKEQRRDGNEYSNNGIYEDILPPVTDRVSGANLPLVHGGMRELKYTCNSFIPNEKYSDTPAV